MKKLERLEGSEAGYIEKLLRPFNTVTQAQIVQDALEQFDVLLDKNIPPADIDPNAQLADLLAKHVKLYAFIDTNVKFAHNRPSAQLANLIAARVDAQAAREAEKSSDPAVRASAYSR